jgi:hypothetical protein
MNTEWLLLWGILLVSNLVIISLQSWILFSCAKYIIAKFKSLDYAIKVTLYRERKLIIDRQAERFGIVARYGCLVAIMISGNIASLGILLYGGDLPPAIMSESDLFIYAVGAIAYPLLLWTIKDSVDFFTKEENDEHVTPMEFSKNDLAELLKMEYQVHD